MDEELGAPPTSLEAPPAPPTPPRSTAAGTAPKLGMTSISPESVNYTTAAERCETCEHFDEEQMYCNLNKFDAEPEGHCDKFELLGSAAGGGGEEIPDEEMPFEEETELPEEEAEEEY